MNWAKFITNISLYILISSGIIILVLFLILAFNIDIAKALIVNYIICCTSVIVGFIAEYYAKEKL